MDTAFYYIIFPHILHRNEYKVFHEELWTTLRKSNNS